MPRIRAMLPIGVEAYEGPLALTASKDTAPELSALAGKGASERARPTGFEPCLRFRKGGGRYRPKGSLITLKTANRKSIARTGTIG